MEKIEHTWTRLELPQPVKRQNHTMPLEEPLVTMNQVNGLKPLQILYGDCIQKSLH